MGKLYSLSWSLRITQQAQRAGNQICKVSARQSPRIQSATLAVFGVCFLVLGGFGAITLTRPLQGLLRSPVFHVQGSHNEAQWPGSNNGYGGPTYTSSSWTTCSSCDRVRKLSLRPPVRNQLYLVLWPWRKHFIFHRFLHFSSHLHQHPSSPVKVLPKDLSPFFLPFKVLTWWLSASNLSLPFYFLPPLFAWPRNSLHVEFVWFALTMWYNGRRSVSFHFRFADWWSFARNLLVVHLKKKKLLVWPWGLIFCLCFCLFVCVVFFVFAVWLLFLA